MTGKVGHREKAAFSSSREEQFQDDKIKHILFLYYKYKTPTLLFLFCS